MDIPIHHDDGSTIYRHCPRCGGVLGEKVVMPHDPPRLVCNACGFVFYVDPKLAVGAICVSPGGIVLLRRAIEPGYGAWVFPGGYVDRGEALEQAARREALEEINARIEIRRLLNVYSYPGRPVVVVVYEADLSGDSECRPGDEALEVRAFGSDAIPWDDLAFRSTRDALRDFLDRRAGRSG